VKTRLILLLLTGAALLAVPARARGVERDTTAAAAEKLIYVGVGVGFEAGNGIRLGGSIGRHGLETGVGVTYLGETGLLQYSFGGRYLYTLYPGAYTWVGVGRMGHRDESDRALLTSGGAGLGVSARLGSMFRLMIDSGWRVYSDSEVEDGHIQINPTINAAIVYIW
jgi:hypothetical protein